MVHTRLTSKVRIPIRSKPQHVIQINIKIDIKRFFHIFKGLLLISLVLELFAVCSLEVSAGYICERVASIERCKCHQILNKELYKIESSIK